MKKLWFLPLIVTLLYNSCTKEKDTGGVWEIEIIFDGVKHHYKGRSDFPMPLNNLNYCQIDYSEPGVDWLVASSGLKSINAGDRVSGADKLILFQSWLNNNGGLPNAMHVSTILGIDNSSYSFGQDLDVEILEAGSGPDFNNSSWGNATVISIPLQTIEDILTGDSHTISGKITAIRKFL